MKEKKRGEKGKEKRKGRRRERGRKGEGREMVSDTISQVGRCR